MGRSVIWSLPSSPQQVTDPVWRTIAHACSWPAAIESYCRDAGRSETWPDAWGGHPAEGWAATGALTLADAARARAVPVLTRHVERYELRTLLGPAEAP